RQAVQVIASSENQVQIGLAHQRLASILTVLGRDAEAEAELSLASHYFDKAPTDPTLPLYRLTSNVNLAELQLRRGQPAAALQALQGAEPLLAATDTNFIALNYFRVLGDANLRLARLEQADVAFRRAIAIADHALDISERDPDR